MGVTPLRTASPINRLGKRARRQCSPPQDGERGRKGPSPYSIVPIAKRIALIGRKGHVERIVASGMTREATSDYDPAWLKLRPAVDFATPAVSRGVVYARQVRDSATLLAMPST